MKIKVLVLAIMFTIFGVSGASADIGLFDWGFNLDGIDYYFPGDSLPGNFNTSGFDFLTGLGNITITYDLGAGGHYVIFFVDHEIDEATNTYFNEFGVPVNTPQAIQSWEIDEPEYFFGDIWTNFMAGNLDNSNGVPSSAPDDVSMALGWKFILAAGEIATLNFNLSTTEPLSGFYLVQTDPDSQTSLYYNSSLNIRGGGGPEVPEPATMLLLGSGLLGLARFGRKRLFKK